MRRLTNDPFLRMSAAFGRDRLLVQAAGGNTSCKEDGLLWVKASGKPLSACGTPAGFVALDLECVRSRLADAREHEPDLTACKRDASSARHSIEASLHAVMPQRIVAHLHPVDPLSWLVREDAQGLLDERLDGLDWMWVGYSRPGVPLTRGIAAAIQQRAKAPSILMLRNHGVVAAADSVQEVVDLVDALCDRIRTAPRTARPATARAAELAGALGWSVAAEPVVHGLANDAVAFGLARAGPLYPDHIVFLGRFPAILDGGCTPAAAKDRPVHDYAIIEHHGVVVSPRLSASALEMLACQAEVLLRIPEHARVRVLSAEETAEIAGWEAEKYRQQMV
jgi:rhamnose utilization protein RhaD (predicted bifunctional aldolase and dehydrogenase)